MINYSIVMRPVNTNLFEINQAKARIKAAQAKDETPNEADVALVKTEVQHAFAVAQYTDVMTIEKFARHISSHGCVRCSWMVGRSVWATWVTSRWA